MAADLVRSAPKDSTLGTDYPCFKAVQRDRLLSDAAGTGGNGERAIALTTWRPLMEPIDPILQYFSYSHLPERLQQVSKPFADLAEVIAGLPDVEERRVALRKLLEAKDAAVRAKLADRSDAPPAIVEASSRA